MNKKYIETEDHTIVLDENSDVEYRENCSNMGEILLKENELEVLKNEKENILSTQKSDKSDQIFVAIMGILMLLGMSSIAIISIYYFTYLTLILSIICLLGSGLVAIKEFYNIKTNNEMLDLVEESIDKLESELTSLKDKKLESEKIKEYNVVKNVDEKGKLLDLKKKLELYSEYMMKKRKYDRLNEKGKLKYKLQKNHTNNEIEIIEGFCNKAHKQKIKKFDE